MKRNLKNGSLNYKYFTNFLIGTFLLLMVFLSGILKAQESIQKAQTEITENQVLVVTNRAFIMGNNDQMLFDANLEPEGTHKYLQANLQGEQWFFSEKSNLNSLMDVEPKYDDWLIFVHGDSKTLQSAVQRAFDIQEIHKVNILVYAWPSKDEEVGAIKNFKNSYENVESSAYMFKDFLVEMEDLKNENWNENQKLSLFFHSLGNYYIERLVLDGYAANFENAFIENLIINAAAVQQEGHSNWVEKIKFSDRIFINSNDDDLSLSGLRVLTRLGRQLGESAEPPLASNAVYVDFTDIVGFPGMGPSHSYYFAEKTMKIEQVKKYYSTIFHGMEPPHLAEELLVLNAGNAN